MTTARAQLDEGADKDLDGGGNEQAWRAVGVYRMADKASRPSL